VFVSAFGIYKINNRLILLIILEINPIRYKLEYFLKGGNYKLPSFVFYNIKS